MAQYAGRDHPTGIFRFVSLAEWGLPGSGDVVAVGFENRESSVATAVHEDFHLHYESRYALAFGDEIGIARGGQTPATRANLVSTHQSARLEQNCTRSVPRSSQPFSRCRRSPGGIRCPAPLHLHSGCQARAPRRPIIRRGLLGTAGRHPHGLDRRAAARMQFRDPSVIGAALTPHGCDMTMTGGYFLVLGGLQAAVLDTFSDPAAWPALVYPRDKTAASSLYLLVQTLFSQFEER